MIVLEINEDLINYGIEESTKHGASYAAVKLSDFKSLIYQVKGNQRAYSSNWIPGCHVRVIVNGAWGFAGSAKVDKNEIEKLTNIAVKLAKANSETRED